MIPIQKTLHGPTTSGNENLKDLSLREKIAIAPVVLIIVVMGFYPKPVLDIINPTAEKVVVNAGFTDPRGKLHHMTQDLTTIDEDFLNDGTFFDGSSIAGWKAINESDLHTYVREFKKEFDKMAVEDIAFPRSCNGVKQYAGSPIYIKGTPIQVRGALLYNHHLRRLGLDKKYQAIRDGDKIKFVYLRTPNPIQEDVIAFSQHLPKELKLETYIDYDKQFEKVFLDALQIVIEPLKWKTQEESSLEDFFG